MKAGAGVALVAVAVMFGTSRAIAGTEAAPQARVQNTSEATDFSARRVYRRYPVHPAYPRYPAYPTYYARPYYYRPYPYALPAPFFLGFGYLPNY